MRQFSYFLLFLPAFLISMSLPRARGEDFEEVQKVLSRGGLAANLFEGSELLDLLSRPAMRLAVRNRIRALVKAGEDAPEPPGPLFEALAASGATAEDVQFLADEIQKSLPDAFASLALDLIERAPLSLSPIIEKRLLDPLARRAASTLRPEPANCLWLLAHRLPLQSVRDRLRSAWRESVPLERRGKDPRMVYGEVLVQGPDGKPLPDLSWSENMGSWSLSQSLVWPDGKVRFERYLGEGQAEETIRIGLAVPGYRNPEPQTLTQVRGNVSRITVKLGEKRASVSGKLSPPPSRPLFARLESAVPFGRELDTYRTNRGEMLAPLRSDGSFRAPAHSRARRLLIHDIDGNVLLAQDVSLPGGGADLELGEVKVPEKRGLVEVPILLEWPAELAAGDAFQGNITWSSAAPGGPRGGTHFSLYGKRAARERPVRLGLARNLPPGGYLVKARFDRYESQGEVSEVEMPFTVKDAKSPLVLKPEKKAGTPAPTPDRPSSALLPVASGSRFDMLAGPSGLLHLLTSDDQGLTLRTREGGKFGPGRSIWKYPAGSEKHVIGLALLVSSDESFHVFLRLNEGDFHQSLHYARVPREAAKRFAWAPIAEGNSRDSYNFPYIYPRKKDVLEVFAHAEAIADQKDGTGLIKNFRLANGVIQNGRYRHVRSIRTDQGPFGGLHMAMIIGEPEADPQALFVERGGGRLSWTGLKRLQTRHAAALPGNAQLHEARLLVTKKAQVYLAIPAPDPAGKGGYRITVARGKPGQALEEALIAESLPRMESSLSEAPDGEVYLIAALPVEKSENRQLALWKVSGAFPPLPLLTPWLGSHTDEPPLAVFTGPGKAVVAWNRGGDIYVEPFALPQD